MNIPNELVTEWFLAAQEQSTVTKSEYIAQRAAEWALSQSVSMEPVLEVTEFDHPEHAWKWTRMELNFINRKLAAARQQGADEERKKWAKYILDNFGLEIE